MKRVLLFVALVLGCAMYGFAQQDNEKISYQAVVRNYENRLVNDRVLSVTVAIANGANEQAVFTERHNTVTSNANGLISLLIGDGERLSGSWENIRWNTAVVTATIVDASTMEEFAVHVLPLQAVPYALYADYADSTDLSPVLNEITETAEQLRSDLADTAAALRNAMPVVSDKKITIMQNNAELGSFTLNQPTDGSINIPTPAAANNGKLTIRRNGQDLGIFTADQIGDTEVDILVPEKLSDLVNDSQFADTTVNNHFTGDNSFTGHNAVTERGFFLDGSNPTTENNCQVMVNACDLLALFDSMQNRINGVMDSLNGRIDSLLGVISDIMNSVPPTFSSLTVGDITSESIKATAAFVTAGAPISSYQFCISKNTDMSNPVGCYTSDVNVYTFTGLDPYTTYYITASATNLAGTANSDVVSGRTLAHAPTAVVTVGQHKPTGFVVNIGSLDFQEVANGTVQICYKQKEGNDCPVDASQVYADYINCVTKENVANSTDIAEIISDNIELDKDHCVIVKVSNEDSTTVYGPFSVTPSNITLTVTGTESVTYQCGIANVTPSYTATLSAGENADDYTFVWTYGNKKDTVGATYTPVLTESTTVTCTVTHNTENFSLSGSVEVTVVNQGTAPVIAICTDSLTVTDKGSENIVKVKWGESANEEFISATTLNHIYSTAGEYTITVESADGCTATRTVAVSEGALRPCTVLDSHPAQLNVAGGIETVEDGKIVSVADKEGNTYSVVQIGNQCWMAENLRATQYSDGTAIPLGTTTTTSSDTAHRYYPNSNQINVDEYGYLYNWQAATKGLSSNLNSGKGVQGACPRGWHIPTNDEWTAMETEVNGAPVTYHDNITYGGTHGGKLATGCAWRDTTAAQSPGNYTFAERNASGFSALPTGRITYSGDYDFYLGAEFWSCTVSSDGAYERALRFDNPGMSTSAIPTKYALSVRCVRDTVSPASQPTMSVTPTSDNVSYCVGSSAQVSYTAAVNFDNLDITSNYTYSWSVSPAEGASLSSTTGTTVTVTYNATTSATDYTVSCTATPTTGSALTETATTSVSSLPTPTFQTSTSELTVTLSNYDNADKIKWEANGTEADFTATHTYDATGTYTITARNSANNCSKSETVTVVENSCVIQNNQVVPSQDVPNFESYTREPWAAGREKGRQMTSGNQIYFVVDSVQDVDNNWYKVVQIGSQCWMKENLRTTKYNNGTAIAGEVTTSIRGTYGSTETDICYSPYNFDNTSLDVEKYGRYYNWYAVNPNSQDNCLCPSGWKVPSNAEWNTMETYVNGGSLSYSGNEYGSHAGKLATCDDPWKTVSGENTTVGKPGNYYYEQKDFYGFSARPSEGYYLDGNNEFAAIQNYGYNYAYTVFWTSSQSSSTNAHVRCIFYNSNTVRHVTYNKKSAFSVRCIRN